VADLWRGTGIFTDSMETNPGIDLEIHPGINSGIYPGIHPEINPEIKKVGE